MAGVTRKALAALLAAALLWTITLSVSPALHQSLHERGAVNSDLCLVCSLAKGHLNAALPAILLTAAAWTVFFLVSRLQPLLLPAGDRRLAPSRAPPRRLLSTRVAG